ncbi:hypothetical protein [Streptomyces sp. NPDC001492]
MPAEVTPSALDHLAGRLEELAPGFPSRPEAVGLVTLTDDIALLAHHLQQATERAQERFTAPATVHTPPTISSTHRTCCSNADRTRPPGPKTPPHWTAFTMR